MNDVGRSSLHGKSLKFIGFSFGKHPTKLGHYVEMSVFQLGKGYVLALSEGVGTGDLKQARADLGAMTSGEEIAPFAQRHLEGLSLVALKKLLIDAIFQKWSWV